MKELVGQTDDWCRDDPRFFSRFSLIVSLVSHSTFGSATAQINLSSSGRDTSSLPVSLHNPYQCRVWAVSDFWLTRLEVERRELHNVTLFLSITYWRRHKQQPGGNVCVKWKILVGCVCDFMLYNWAASAVGGGRNGLSWRRWHHIWNDRLHL